MSSDPCSAASLAHKADLAAQHRGIVRHDKAAAAEGILWGGRILHRSRPKPTALNSDIATACFQAEGQARAEGGIGDYVAKPKWMRWRTYDRALARIDRAGEAVEAHTALLLDRLKQTGLDS